MGLDRRRQGLLRCQRRPQSGIRCGRLVSESVQVLVARVVLSAVPGPPELLLHAEHDRHRLDRELRHDCGAHDFGSIAGRGSRLALGSAGWPLWTNPESDAGAVDADGSVLSRKVSPDGSKLDGPERDAETVREAHPHATKPALPVDRGMLVERGSGGGPGSVGGGGAAIASSTRRGVSQSR
ncbi:hypothetical protein NSND_60355 [Nitrospira sp. ND1]|nr:hypothetical protein NSND_60355 [Nitrospira sp. ND1]